MKKFNIVEFFSGIGSQARALENIGIKQEEILHIKNKYLI